MDPTMKQNSGSSRWLSRALLIFFLAIAAFFLWTEHRAHLLGVLPWILLVACCVVLFFGLHSHKDTSAPDDTRGRAS